MEHSTDPDHGQALPTAGDRGPTPAAGSGRGQRPAAAFVPGHQRPAAAPGPEQAAAAVPDPVRSRIGGIDIARGVAIVGMVMVHIGPQTMPGGGLVGAAYRSSHGRASILFIVLAGVGVSLLTRRRDPGTLATGRRRLWWRALILLPIGLYLQELPTSVAVILQYYAAYFVVASLLLRLGDRALLAVSAASLLLGPALLVWLHQVAPGSFEPGVPRWNDVGRVFRDVFVTGYYPVIVWMAPLTFGMWLGRRDLAAPGRARRLLAGGALVAAAGFVASDLLVAWLGAPAGEADWRSLAVIEPHNEMPLWIVTASAIAVAIIGGCVALARRLPRPTWPLVAFGQLAFTVYVGHVLVLAYWPDLLVREQFVPAWRMVALFTLLTVTLAAVYRRFAARGPLELLLRLPLRR